MSVKSPADVATELIFTRFVVDGSNIAHLPAGRGVRASSIVAIREALVQAFTDVPIVTICDASLRHRVADPDCLHGLFESGCATQVPAGKDADEYILRYARKHHAVVVSTDQFNDRPAYRANIPLLKPLFVGDDVVIPDAVEFESATASRSRPVHIKFAASIGASVRAPRNVSTTKPSTATMAAPSSRPAAVVVTKHERERSDDSGHGISLHIRRGTGFSRTYYESKTITVTELRGSAPLRALRVFSNSFFEVQIVENQVTVKASAAAVVKIDGALLMQGDSVSLAVGRHSMSIAGTEYELHVLVGAG